MEEEKRSSAPDIFIPGLALMFIAFKLLNITVVAQWSWFWVLSPIWIPIALVILIGIGGFIFAREGNVPIFTVLYILVIVTVVGYLAIL